MNSIKFCSKCGNPIGENEKFCGKCGASVEEMLREKQPATAPVGNGAPVQENVQPQQNVQQNIPPQQTYQQPAYNNANPQAVQAKPPFDFGGFVKSHIAVIAIAGVALVAIVVAIIILVNMMKYQVIDAKDLFRVEFRGLDSCGTAFATLNDKTVYLKAISEELNSDKSIFTYEEYDKISLVSEDDFSDYFSSDESKLKKAWTKADTKSEARKMKEYLLKTDTKGEYKLKINLDKTTDLKNGDKIKCTVDYDKDYLKDKNIKLKNTEYEIEVEDLQTGEEFDPFKGVEVTYGGYYDGLGYAEIAYPVDTDTDLINYEYNDNKQKDYNNGGEEYGTLSNGDKFTVTATLNADLKTAGDKKYFSYDGKYYIVDNSKLTKDFEVSGLAELQELDPFAELKYETSRAQPYLTIYSVDTSEITDDIIKKNIFFRVEENQDLKSGDTFTVKAGVNSPTKLAKEGYKLKGEKDEDGYVSKEITVDESLPTYATVDNAGTAEKAYSKIIQDVTHDLKDGCYVNTQDTDDSYFIEKGAKLTYVESFFNVNNAESSDDINYSDDGVQLVSVYKMEGKSDDKKNITYVGLIIHNPYTVNGKFITKNADKYDIGVMYYSKLPALEKDVPAGTDSQSTYTSTKYDRDKQPTAKKDDSSSTTDSSSSTAESSSTADSSSTAESSSTADSSSSKVA